MIGLTPRYPTRFLVKLSKNTLSRNRLQQGRKSRVAPDIRPFSISGIRPDIRLAGSPDIQPEKLFQQVKSITVEQQKKLQYKILYLLSRINYLVIKSSKFR